MTGTPQDDEARRRQLAEWYRDIFEIDRRGIAIFNDLYARYAARAKVHTTGGIDAVLRTYQAAAHREVIEHIVTMVNRGNKVPDPPQPQEDDHG